jgi:hypothetical protein
VLTGLVGFNVIITDAEKLSCVPVFLLMATESTEKHGKKFQALAQNVWVADASVPPRRGSACRNTEYRRQKTEDRRQKTEDRRQKTMRVCFADR